MAKKIIKIIIAILIAIVLGYLILNFKAAFKYIKYIFNADDFSNQETMANVNNVVNTNSSTARKNIKNELREDWLEYPRLGIKAPIFWNITETESNSKMNFGLTHIKGTAIVGNGGQGLITGHSSNYWWQKGEYNEIFTNLMRAKNGDNIIINKNGIRVYRVESLYEIDSRNFIQFSLGGQEKIKLMTCVPIGTNLRRFIVEAELIRVF